MKCIMIYIAEAHADDVWPLGYGINSAKTLEDRQSNCAALISRYPQLHEKLDAIFIDNMNDDFNKVSGAWPESYMFVNSNGNVIWKSESGNKDSLDHAIAFAKSQDW